MGRIYERFVIPKEYAGKIEGRSSYARMGLMVHCTGDFINPGWSGYMPLQLYNAGPVPLQIYPYLSICQLMLVKLTSTPTRTYGDEELQSKYINDDGGPSYWWRERRVKQLQERMENANVALGIQRRVVELVRFEDPDLLEHFERYVLRRRPRDLQNADSLLDAFSAREDRRRLYDTVAKWAFPALFLALVGSAFARPYGLPHLVLLLATLGAGAWAGLAWFWHPATYLGRRELQAIRQGE